MDTILILGGSGSLGQSLKNQAEKNGYRVLTADLDGTGADLSVDVTSEESLNELIEGLCKKEISINHVVNTVGVLVEDETDNFWNAPVDVIAKTLQINLLSQILPIKQLTKSMMLSGGDKSFTMISSINASHGYSIPYYSAAKAGLAGFLKPAAIELGALGIRLNSVSPGTVETPVTTKQTKDFNDRSQAAALKRLCSQEEISQAVLSCINMTGYTGQNLIIDAGQSINPASSIYRQRGHGLISKP